MGKNIDVFNNIDISCLYFDIGPLICEILKKAPLRVYPNQLNFVTFVTVAPFYLHPEDGYTCIAKMSAKCEKLKVYSGVFRATFYSFRISHQGKYSHEKSKDFVVYFFTALIKHKIRMKYE